MRADVGNGLVPRANELTVLRSAEIFYRLRSKARLWISTSRLATAASVQEAPIAVSETSLWVRTSANGSKRRSCALVNASMPRTALIELVVEVTGSMLLVEKGRTCDVGCCIEQNGLSNNELLSISGVSTYRVALTDTRSA
jgi:hypothetical protein